jgi:nucleotide-binding universal stress UspA family protein
MEFPMRSILIATDGLPCSREAIHYFLEMACIGAANIHVLSVIPTVTLSPDDPDRDVAFQAEVGAAQQALGCAALDIALAGSTVRVHSREGDPAAVIVKLADELAVDMIVLGTRGAEEWSRLVLAGDTHVSVAETVLAHAKCGVLIYPMRASQPPQPVLHASVQAALRV